MSRAILVGLGGLVLLLSACGDDGPGHAADIRPRLQTGAGEIVLTDVVCPPIDGYAGPVADHGVGAVADGELVIDAGDFFFGPTCSVNGAGDTVSMTVTNSGGILHNVSVADQSIDVDIKPGETVVVEIAVGEVPLVYICKYHRTAGMVGALLPGV